MTLFHQPLNHLTFRSTHSSWPRSPRMTPKRVGQSTKLHLAMRCEAGTCLTRFMEGCGEISFWTSTRSYWFNVYDSYDPDFSKKNRILTITQYMYVFYYHNTLQHSKVIENKTIVAILLLYWFVMLPFQAVTQNTS
jgi:hypothetical protein